MGAVESVAVGDELGRLKRLGMTKLAECLLSVPKACPVVFDKTPDDKPKDKGFNIDHIFRQNW